jgi:chondroitin 4-sulfotransferase 11
MYLPELGCLFVHIPKTAGNSIMRAFGIGWENHMDLSRYRETLGPEILAGCFKFAIVRNPWDRILSEYNFQRKKKQRADTVRLFLTKPDGTTRTFREWVEHALAHPEEHQPKQWGGKTSPFIHRLSPQIDWVTLDDSIGVDFVGRMESLQKDIDTVCQRLDLPRKRLSRVNWKLHWHYSRYYDDTTRKLVGDYYERDIDSFGYRFGK